MINKIFFSPGHTANKPGAIVEDLNEYQIAYTLTRAIEQHFVSEKRIVFGYNQPLKNKIEWINDRRNRIDLAIELHFNAAYQEKASGTEVWYWSEKGKTFAEIFQKQLLELQGIDRGIKKGVYWRLIKGKKVWFTLAFLRQTIPPAIILEPLFLTHLFEAAAIRSSAFQGRLIKVIEQGLGEILA